MNPTTYLLLLKVLLLCIVFYAKDVTGYECYVCKSQDNNREKCVKTVQTCDLAESNCMTTVRWGSTPYWDPKGQKQFYISKGCATPIMCEMARQNTSRRCDRIWYNDWECVECCSGDRCNYYITLGTANIRANLFTVIVSAALAITTVRLLQ